MAFLAWTKKSFHSLVDFVSVDGLRRMMKESKFFQLVKFVFTSTIIGAKDACASRQCRPEVLARTSLKQAKRQSKNKQANCHYVAFTNVR